MPKRPIWGPPRVKIEILTPKIFSFLKDQNRVLVFAFLTLNEFKARKQSVSHPTFLQFSFLCHFWCNMILYNITARYYGNKSNSFYYSDISSSTSNAKCSSTPCSPVSKAIFNVGSWLWIKTLIASNFTYCVLKCVPWQGNRA